MICRDPRLGIFEYPLNLNSEVDERPGYRFAQSNPRSQVPIVVSAYNAPPWIRSIARYRCDGTADQDQFNAAIAEAASTGGRRVHASGGDFTVNGPILARGGLLLSGEGWRNSPFGTQISMADGADCNMIEPPASGSSSYFWLADMHLYGNKANQSSGHGLSDTGSKSWGADVVIKGCLINHFKENCVNISNSDTLRHLEIANTTIEYGDGYCLYVVVPDDAGHKLQLNSVDIEGTGTYAMHIEGFNASGRGRGALSNVIVSTGRSTFKDVQHTSIAACHFRDLYCTGCDNMTLSGSGVEGVLQLSNCDWFRVSGGTGVTGNFFVKDEEGGSPGSVGLNLSGMTVQGYADINHGIGAVIAGNTFYRYVQLRSMNGGVIRSPSASPPMGRRPLVF